MQKVDAHAQSLGMVGCVYHNFVNDAVWIKLFLDRMSGILSLK